MGRMNGRVALVTGAADGLGLAICEELAGEGATVVATDINVAGVEALATKLGNNSVGLNLDVRSEASWDSVIAEINARFGSIHTLVNNAGGQGAGTIESTDIDFYRNCMALNTDSTFIGIQKVLPLMKNDGGSIVNISSIHGIRAAAHAAAYSAAKGAVRLLTKSVALHCAQSGYKIRCNSVHPGYIGTTQVLKWVSESEDPDALMADLVSRHPVGHLGTPTDIAKGVLYLASDDSSFMTGSELVLDGGFCLM